MAEEDRWKPPGEEEEEEEEVDEAVSKSNCLNHAHELHLILYRPTSPLEMLYFSRLKSAHQCLRPHLLQMRRSRNEILPL